MVWPAEPFLETSPNARKSDYFEKCHVQKIENMCGPRDRWLDNAAVMQAIEDGWLERSQSNEGNSMPYLRATGAGKLRLDHIIAMILR